MRAPFICAWDWAHPSHICTGTGRSPGHICSGTGHRGTVASVSFADGDGGVRGICRLLVRPGYALALLCGSTALTCALWNEQNEHMETAMALVVADAGVESAQLDDLTVAQLHILCAACGLTKTGRKADLLVRLRAKLGPEEEELPLKKQKTEVRSIPPITTHGCACSKRFFMCAGKRGGAAGEDARVRQRRRFGG